MTQFTEYLITLLGKSLLDQEGTIFSVMRIELALIKLYTT